MSQKLTLESLKEMGAVILIPQEHFAKLVDDSNNYTRVYFQGIRIMWGWTNWDDYHKHLYVEKVFLDDTEVKP